MEWKIEKEYLAGLIEFQFHRNVGASNRKIGESRSGSNGKL